MSIIFQRKILEKQEDMKNRPDRKNFCLGSADSQNKLTWQMFIFGIVQACVQVEFKDFEEGEKLSLSLVNAESKKEKKKGRG